AAEHRTQTSRRGSAYQIALVGYTNAGKSTLMNALSDSDVFVEDRLFATLDTTTRRLQLGEHQALISDTVGFIRKLPHDLVASFRTTLSEVREADLIIKVLDAGNPQVEEHYRTINEVLADMNVADQAELVVLNKIDAIGDTNSIDRLQRIFPSSIMISARQRLRIDTLERAIVEKIIESHVTEELRLPLKESKIISEIYDCLKVEESIYEDNSVMLRVSGPHSMVRQFRHRLENLDKQLRSQ
ncbi:MAG: 50S ribosome-binding GTPase, partial [Candidatus Marinimicrobia bacterium]|nr:50S ribosome-binding GTPase [Candidatus Neomarinimicrobiota bacterium]